MRFALIGIWLVDGTLAFVMSPETDCFRWGSHEKSRVFYTHSSLKSPFWPLPILETNF